MQTVPVLSKEMLLERKARLVDSAAKVTEETMVVRRRELVLVLIPFALTTWSGAQMPQEQWFRREISEAGVTLEAVSNNCPVKLQGLVAPRCPGVDYVVGD